MYLQYFGTRMVKTEIGNLIDFGECHFRMFDRAMSIIDSRMFLTRHSDPCIHDGRGAALMTGTDIGRAIDAMVATPPSDYHYLLGIIPW